MRRVAVAAVLSVAVAGCTTASVVIERLEPPLAEVSGIGEVAVLPFADRSAEASRGEAAAARVADILKSTGRYRVIAPDRMRRLMERAKVPLPYAPDAALVRKIGTALGADAVLYGEIEKFQVQEQNRVVKEREQVWTGEYVRDRRGNIISSQGEKGEAVPRKKYRSELVEKNFLRRCGALDLHVRMADASLGNVICAESESESGEWKGMGAAEIAKMPSADLIFELLLDRAAKKFTRQVAAHPIQEERVLEYGTFHATRLGVELAKNNLWDEAMDKWLQATKAMPQEPAGYYNLGVGFERKGMLNFAYKAYQNALTRSPKSDRYIKAVARLQKLIKDLR